ncbi:MAG: pyridoxal phosphate-dependent aminotransferase [Bacteroidetes bacterium]|nr:MAG: pyridoxal phosphate-dependent aminotransferase [Bacteroidota bacterium]
MIQLSKRLESMEESATLAMSRVSRELKTAGQDIISLSLGEPDFHTPDFIKAAAIEAMKLNYTSYTPVPGYDDLRESIVEKFRRDNHLEYTKDQIVVSTGAKQSIANVVLSCINPGDEVIIPAPYWVSYVEIVKVAEGIPHIVSAGIENDFKITAEQLRQSIGPKSKMMIFSSPCNPTGSVYSQEELEALADVIAEHPQLVVISDEIYEHINFSGGHYSLARIPKVKEQVVTVNGVSKAWAMTGWRLGFIGAPKRIADACTKIQGQFTSGTCSITQRATIAAMKADPSILNDMVAAFKNRRDLVLDYLQKMPGVKTNVPEGAFYLFPDVSAYFGKTFQGEQIESASDLCMYLLREVGVALVTGEAFGDPNCIRISYAASEEELHKAMQRVGEALSKLNQ